MLKVFSTFFFYIEGGGEANGIWQGQSKFVWLRQYPEFAAAVAAAAV